MKLRWREHELILISIFASAQILIVFAGQFDFDSHQLEAQVRQRFNETGMSFNYWRNFIFPQVGSILLFYIAYLLVNFTIVPRLKKISSGDTEKVLSRNLLIPVAVFLITAYFVAIGGNGLSYFGKPHLVNYAGYRLLALLSYNDQPLTNLLFGFERSLVIVLILIVLAALRELFIWLISKNKQQREFRITLVNTATSFCLFYILFLLLINPDQNKFRDYIAWVTPIVGLLHYNIYLFFPFKERYAWHQKEILKRLLISTSMGAFFGTVVYAGSNKVLHFFLYWLFLLIVVTPLSWVLYQYRRDKILQLKGLENELAHRTKDLQFLRSQINPHFLFNALNTLYGTAWKEKAEQTATGIQMLGDMMRFMLEENHLDAIPMVKELQYLKNYIALQRLRIPDTSDIIIEDNIEEVRCSRQIAPMLLIPFVENAFKHGISLQEKSWIFIDLICEEDRMEFQVRNSLHLNANNDTACDRSGIGLNNVKERLRILYSNKHTLKLTQTGNEFIAKLIIY